MIKSDWSGVFPYLPTPTDDREEFAPDALTSIVQTCIAAGVDGVTPLGSSGEIALLNADTKRRVIATTVTASAGQVPVIAGVSGFSAHQLVAEARAACDAGADGILLILHAYYPLTEGDILRAVGAVSHAVQEPLVLYNNPPLTHVDLTPTVIAKAVSEFGVRYVKDASGSITRIPMIQDQTSGAVHVFAATAVSPTAAMLLGAAGWMSGPASVFPRAAVRIRDAVRAGNWSDAVATERALAPVLSLFRRLGPPGAVKALFAAVDTPIGAPISPLSPPGRADIAEAKAAARCVRSWLELRIPRDGEPSWHREGARISGPLSWSHLRESNP